MLNYYGFYIKIRLKQCLPFMILGIDLTFYLRVD